MPNGLYFDVPFAEAGDVVTIPDPAQLDGSVSYEQGFPVTYSTPVNTGGKNVPRTAFNQVLFDITSAIQNLQQNGAPPFITTAMNNGSPYPYTEGTIVVQAGNVWISLINNNTNVPGVGAGNVTWRLMMTIPSVGQCIFQYTSTSVVTLLPKKGNQISFPTGAVGILPVGGYASNNASCYVGGVAAQPLAANTLYYAYASFNPAGNLVVDFWTTPYQTDPTTGITTRNGDNTRVLVGMVETDVSSLFVETAADIQVRSWFNESGIFTSANLSGNFNTASPTSVELDLSSRNNLLLWAGERITTTITGTASNSVNADGVAAGVGIDSTTVVSGGEAGNNSVGANGGVNISTSFTTNTLTEGLHFFTLLGRRSAGGQAQYNAGDYVQCVTSR